MNPNHYNPQNKTNFELANVKAFETRGLFARKLSSNEGYALRKLPIYYRSGRYETYCPYFPFFKERYLEQTMRILNELVRRGTIRRMLVDQAFKQRFRDEFYHSRTLVFSPYVSKGEAKLTFARGPLIKQVVRNIRLTCPAFHYWLKDKPEPPSSVICLNTEEEQWLSLIDTQGQLDDFFPSGDTFEIEGHGMQDVIQTVSTHTSQAFPFVIGAIAASNPTGMSDIFQAAQVGVGVYALTKAIVSQLPTFSSGSLLNMATVVGDGLAKGVSNSISVANIAAQVAIGSASVVSPVLRPIADFFNTVDKGCCDHLPLWGRLPDLIRYVIIAFVGACVLYALYKAGNSIAVAAAEIIGKWMGGATTEENEIVGHSMSPIICATMLFSAVSMNYDATKGFSMFRSLYSMTKTLEADFSIESTFRKWTNRVCSTFGMPDVFTTATLMDEWDRAVQKYTEIEEIPNLDKEMVDDHTLPTRIRAVYKELSDIEKAMRPCRQVPANYKSTAAATCLRAVKLMKEIVRKNSRFSNRTEPIWMDLRGPPGHGKTTSGETLLATAFYILHGRKMEPGDKCSKAPSSQYWNGYHEGVWAVVLQELCTCSIPEKNLYDVSFLLNAIGTDFCPLDMADVESKGMMGFCSPVIMSTGNGDYEQAPIADKGALRRRITFPLEVKKIAELPVNPKLKDFDTSWSFSPSEDWLKHPSSYTGVWPGLVDTRQLSRRTWNFTEILKMFLESLGHNKTSKAFSEHAPDLAVELAVLGIDGQANEDIGLLMSEDEDNDYFHVTHGNRILGFNEDGTWHELDEQECEVLARQAPTFLGGGGHVLGMLTSLMGYKKQVHIVREYGPRADQDSVDYMLAYDTDACGEVKQVIPRRACCYRNSFGTWVNVPFVDMLELAEMGVVRPCRVGLVDNFLQVRSVEERGDKFSVCDITLEVLVKCMELGHHLIYMPDDEIPYLVFSGWDIFLEDAGYSSRMKRMDSYISDWVTEPFVKGVAAVKKWNMSLTPGQISMIALSVPVVIGSILAINYAINKPVGLEAQSDGKGKFHEYIDADDLYGMHGRKKHRNMRHVAPQRVHRPNKHEMPAHYQDQYDMDWYELEGQSGTDPTPIVSNLRKISVSGTNSVCWALLMDQNCLITVRHIFCHGGVIKLYSNSSPVRATTYSETQFEVIHCDGSDLCMVVFKTPMVSIKSIWKHITPEYEVPKYTRRLTPIATAGLLTSVMSRESSIRVVDGNWTIKQVPEELKYPITYYAQVADPSTKLGDCGLPYVSNVGGSDKIIGIHFGGHRGVACMTLINRELLMTLREVVATEIKAHASPLETVTDFSVVPSLPGADIVGIIDNTLVPMASQPPNRMRWTELQRATDKSPPEMTFNDKPAELRGKVALKATDFLKRGDTNVDPLLNHLLKRDDWLLGTINWDEFLATPLEDPLSVKPYELLLGKDGHLKSVNDKTSIGPLYKRGIYTVKGKKVQSKKELWCNETGFVEPEFLSKCVSRVRDSQRGIFTPTVVEARYKQELRDVQAKGTTLAFKDGKEVFRGSMESEPDVEYDHIERGLIPREFYVSCPVDNFEIRALLWPYMERKHSLTNCNGCQVGINPYSTDWKILDDRTSRHGNLMIMDVKSCDKTVMRLMQPSFERKILHAYNAEPGTMLHTWIRTIVAKVFCYEAIVAYEVEGVPKEFVASFMETVASGLWVTSELDGDWVNFLFRTAFDYIKIKQGVSASFDENVTIAVYGDDNILDVSDLVAPWFNRVSVAQFCHRHFGVTMTSLRKIPIIHEKIPIYFDRQEDKEFLKRKFHHDRMTNSVLAPLDTSSVWNSLIWTSHKPMIESEAIEYYGQILAGALYEMCLHGPTTFSQFVDYFKPKYQRLGGVWQREWNYRAIRQKAIERSKSTDSAQSHLEFLRLLGEVIQEPFTDPMVEGFDDSLDDVAGCAE